MRRIYHFIKNLHFSSILPLLDTINMSYVTFVVLTVVAFTTAFTIPTKEAEKELKLLHVVMRHGIRTPVSTYPKDPYASEAFEPNGWGQLTNNGIADLHKFGKYLRERYGDFLGDRYNSKEYYCQATGVDRALASVMSVNSGLWKPDKAQTWNEDLAWFPIPIMSEPLDQDMLLLVRKDCPQFNIELQNVETSEEVQAKLEKNKDLMAYIEESTGQKIRNFYDIEDVYTTLLAEKSYGLELPSWTDGYFPEKMKEPAGFSFVLKAYNEKLQRLRGGVLLKKLLSDWKAKSTNTISPKERKAFVYGGHDSTVSNILSALKIFDPQVPNYGMAVIFELSLDKASDVYGLEIFVKNSTADPIQLQLPGCDKFCPLDEVVSLTKDVVPVNWVEECATDDPNYTTAKPSGP